MRSLAPDSAPIGGPTSRRMGRRAALALPLALAFLLAISTASAQAISVSLLSPTPGSYANAMPISYTLSDAPQNTARLVFTYTAGTQATVGSTWTVLIAGVSITRTFTLNTLDPVATPGSVIVSVTPSAGATGTSLPEGTYDLVAQYEAAMTPGTGTSSTVAVTIDRTTATPTLTNPASSSASAAPLGISYTLPETALNGSAKLTFASASVVRVVTLVGSAGSSGSHSFSLDPANPTAAPEVASILGGSTIPDDTYDVTLAYQDALGNTAASAVRTSVRLDTVTAVPILVSPLAGSSHETGLPVTYTLSEAGLASSATLELTGAATRTIELTDVSAGSHAVTLNRLDLASSAGVSGVTGGSTLPDGTYAVKLSYRDALGNATSFVTAANITLTSPPAATTTTPAPTATPTTTVLSTPTALAPLAPVVATLKASWKATTTKGRRTLRATFKPYAGAQRYRLVATRGKTKRTGACRSSGKGSRRRIVCTVSVPRKGTWSVRASARAATGTELAVGTKRLRAR